MFTYVFNVLKSSVISSFYVAVVVVIVLVVVVVDVPKHEQNTLNM